MSYIKAKSNNVKSNIEDKVFISTDETFLVTQEGYIIDITWIVETRENSELFDKLHKYLLSKTKRNPNPRLAMIGVIDMIENLAKKFNLSKTETLKRAAKELNL